MQWQESPIGGRRVAQAPNVVVADVRVQAGPLKPPVGYCTMASMLLAPFRRWFAAKILKCQVIFRSQKDEYWGR